MIETIQSFSRTGNRTPNGGKGVHYDTISLSCDKIAFSFNSKCKKNTAH